MAKQVLIIEDDDGVAKAVAEAISGLGEITAVIAKNGASGVERFTGAVFDAVILDILLPGGMDGYKVAEAIRDTPAGARVPIVVMSGFLKDPKAQKDLQSRFAVKTFLQKPVKPEDLRAVVGDALGLARAASNPALPALNPADSAPAKLEAFNANLRSLPMAMLFGELFRRKAEGVLDLTRGQTKKRIYLQRGFFRYATSNVRAETLAGLAVAKGVPEARLNEAMARAKAEGIALTEALLELRVVTDRDLATLLVAQTEEVAITALAWPDGMAAFKPAPVNSGPEGRANPVMTVVRGMKRVVSTGEARAALEAQKATVLERTPEFEREHFAIRNLFPGESVTPAINGKATVGEILGRAKEPDIVLLHALVACGLAKAKGALPVHLGMGARPATENAAPVGGPARPDTSSVRKNHSAEEKEARDTIFAEAKRIEGTTTHYQLLGVPPAADAAALKAAYFRMARTFHADAYAGMDLGNALPVLEDIFKKVTEANRVLSSEEERATYDLILHNKSKGLPTSVEQIMQAEASFQRAEGSRKAGRLKDAEKLYREAVAMNAGEANYLFALATSVQQLQGKSGSKEVLELLDKTLKIKQDFKPAMLLRGQLLLEAGDAKQALELGRKVMGLQADFEGAMDLVRAAKTAMAGGGAAPATEKGGLLGKLFGSKGK